MGEINLRQRAFSFLFGLLAGLLSSGLLLLFINQPPGYPIELRPPATASMISIHVSGAVAEPGVYSLAPGSIAQQAVEAAGGLLEEANLDLVNLAARLEDGEQLHVPLLRPTELDDDNGSPLQSTPYNDRININTAEAPELEQLPGIGPSLAQSIIEYREQHGLFQSIEELTNVPGIGPAKMADLIDLIRLQ
jgi:competence protein ComEA